MSIEQARRETAIINASIEQGGSPAQVKRAHKEETTFSELFEEYLERHSKIRKQAWKRDEANYKLYLEKPLGKKRLSEINRQHIANIHSEIMTQFKDRRKNKEEERNKKVEPKRKSGATANRIIEFASSIFGWGISSGLCETNPVKGIRKNREYSRDRFLQPDELKRFFKAVSNETNGIVRDYLMLSLFTGARRADMLAMRWDQVSFDRKVWRIPRTKNGESLSIPLTQKAIKILMKRKKNNSEFVFQGNGKTGHLVEFKRIWRQILIRSEIKDLRLHDLRRTLGSWQAIMGSSTLIIGKSLGHKSQDATAIYARLNLDPVRKSLETATQAMFSAANSRKS